MESTSTDTLTLTSLIKARMELMIALASNFDQIQKFNPIEGRNCSLGLADEISEQINKLARDFRRLVMKI